jgi:hypothetical protein
MIAAALASAAPAAAQTTGLVPLTDLGPGTYQGFQGGLYPGGANEPPLAHAHAAFRRALEIVPRDAAGSPDPAGFIVMIAVGMSNTTHEFAVFERLEDADLDRNARVVLMDTALGGQDATTIADPNAAYWTVMARRLQAMGLTAAQVQTAWLKEAQAAPPNNFPLHAQSLRDDLERIVQNLHERFPNLKLCYVSSRTYGGYATGTLNPEPQAYESGFSVKWLVEDQIGGDPDLNHGQVPGPVRAPVLLWGPYLWADGINPRSDGLTWLRSDFEGDGTHTSPAGEAKVAALLSAFFDAEPTAAPWWPRVWADAALAASDALKDAHVASSSPSSNFGGSPQLLAQGGALPAVIHAGFDVSGLPRPAALVKLSLRVVQSGGGRVAEVADTSWQETTITWANAPPAGAPLVEMPQSSRDGTIAADVTGAVNGDADGLVSFALTTSTAGALTYHSREAGQPPRLAAAVPCASASGDGDLDGRPDLCDCAPGDASLVAPPDEVTGLHWIDAGRLAWDALAPRSGSGTRYDVLRGDLAEAGMTGTGPADVCLADDVPAAELADPSPDPAPASGRFYLVRGDGGCGTGRWRTSSAGRDRATAACF